MIHSLTAAVVALATSAAFAAPITTVPWNGRTGAVSFTYDDARTSQIPNLIPQLDSLGIKATFFISIQNIGDFNARRAAWIQAARNGHELTNHTYAHADVNGSDGAAVTNMVKAMADTLRRIDPTIPSLTFAYPNCNLTTNATAKNGISAENYMARGCGSPTLSWGSQPSDWMNIAGTILGPTSASSAVTSINAAKTNNRWYITILHDVGQSPDQYSMTPANNRVMLEAAVSAGVWIDTYERIGAYYRAHFTIDTAKAVAQGNGGWKIQWVSPHAKMPKSVPLRVKLDSSTIAIGPVWVTQGDTTITRQPDGTYVIDFMKLQLTVNSGVSVSPALLLRHAALHARLTGKRLDLSGLPPGDYAVGLHDASGRMVQKRNIRSAGTREQAFYFATTPSNGLYQLTLRQSASGPVRTVSLLILK